MHGVSSCLKLPVYDLFLSIVRSANHRPVVKIQDLNDSYFVHLF